MTLGLKKNLQNGKNDVYEPLIRFDKLLAMSQSEREEYLRKYREQKEAQTLQRYRDEMVAKYGEELSDKQVLNLVRYEEEALNRRVHYCKFCKGKCLIDEPKIPRLSKDMESYEIIPCPFYQQVQMRKRLKSAQIPERYMGKSFEDYEVDEKNKEAVEYAKRSLSEGLGAWLHGDYGSGKTYLAALVAQEWLRANKKVIFIKVPRLLADIRSTFNKRDGGSETDIVKDLIRADLLVLDDLGMEKASQFVSSTLCTLIDGRYDREAATIVTSNGSPAQIGQILDNATDGYNVNGSRMVDRCRQFMRAIKLGGGSRRK